MNNENVTDKIRYCFKKKGRGYLPFFNVWMVIPSCIKMGRFGIALLISAILVLSFHQARATTYNITADMDIVGEITDYKVNADDTLYGIARQFDVGIVELMAANPGIDPWVPPVGKMLSIPTSYILPEVRRGIVINLSELRLYYFPGKKKILTFPIGIGRDGWQTPLGETSITLKRKNPSWTPPASILAVKPDLPKFVPAGPDNPLGQYALNLGWPAFAIHGTNKPHGIGLRSSHGCIRMYPEDIEELFNSVSKGTKVTVIDNPYKLGWRGGSLHLEATPTQEHADAIIEYKRPEIILPREIYITLENIERILGLESINWRKVDEILAMRSGIPIEITVDTNQEK